MSTLIATIGLIWLSLIFIVPKITRGNVVVNNFSVSMVPPALVASMSVLMLVCATGIVAMLIMCMVGLPVHLKTEIIEPGAFLVNELMVNLVSSSTAIVLTSKLAPTLIMVAGDRWAIVAGLPIAAFLTVIGLMSAAPTLV